MKKMNWLYLVLVIALLANCEGNKKNDPPNPPINVVTVDTPKTVISLAQLVLDTLIDSPTLLEEAKAGNLKKLWKYDEQLYLKSSSSKKFIVTKEINPCCPCSSIDPMCCQCSMQTDFAAMSDMQARVTLDGASLQTASAITDVDLFTIPRGTTGTHLLKISGRAVPAVTYSITIVDGTIRFK